MIKVLMAVLAVLVTASVAFAAYPASHPCVATQKVDPVTGAVTSVAPDQRVASVTGGVNALDLTKCAPSYFGAQDANRRITPESGGESGSGAGAGTGDNS